MKIAKYISLILAVLMVLACVLPIVSCDGQALDPCAQGHVSGDWSVISEPTATATGMKTKSCKHCSAITEVETIAATGVEDPCKDGHLPDKWIVEQEATATNAGIQKKVCTRCKQITDLEIIPATEPYVDPCEDGHTPSAWTVIKAATATTEGIQKKSCTVCGDILELDVIPATDPYVDPCKNGHTPGEWSIITAATATTEGVQKKTCTACGDILEIAVIPATDPYVDPCEGGHTPSEWTVIKAATATTEGIRKKSCTVCGDILELDVIPATDPYVDPCKNGHTPGEWSIITAATATTEGVQKKTCTACGDILEIAVIPATDPYVDPCKNGHTPGEWVCDERKAVCFDVIKRKTCTVCGDILDVGIDQGAGHLECDDRRVVEGSCTTQARYEIYCEICETTLFEFDDGFRHQAGEWVVTTWPTYTDTGLKECRCVLCNELLYSEVLPKKEKYDANGRENDDLPGDLNYDGNEVVVLYWSDADHPEFEQEYVTGDNVLDAIFDRNRNVETRLNVYLSFVGLPAAYNGAQAPFLKHLATVYDARTQDYDIVAAYARTQATLAVNGYLENLASIQDSYIDLEKPWWSQQLVDSVTIGDGYYFLSGDMSTNTLWMMRGMFINKDMFSQYQIEYPYQSVRDGAWTIDELIEVTSGIYRDLDYSNTESFHDRYGFVSLHHMFDSFYVGSGMSYIAKDETGLLALSPDLASANAVRLVNKLGAWSGSDSFDVWTLNSNDCSSDDYDSTMQLFKNGRALIYMDEMDYLEEVMQWGVDFSFGVLPIPKYSEAQTAYYTDLGDSWTLYGIFRGFDDRGDRSETLSMFSAVLECYASEAYRLTAYELFEVNMRLKWGEGWDEREMYYYIHDAVVFDFGKIFASDLSNISTLISSTVLVNGSWSNVYNSYEKSIEDDLAALVASFPRR